MRGVDTLHWCGALLLGLAAAGLGNPAKPVRRLSDKEIEQLYYSAKHYVRLKDEYLKG